MSTITPSAIRECFPYYAARTDEKKLRRLLILKEEVKDLQTIGRSFHLIFNYVSLRYAYVGYRIRDLFGYEADQLLIHGVEFLNKLIHVEDNLPYLTSLNKINHHLYSVSPQKRRYYQASFDFRARGTQGESIRVLQQMLAWEFDEEGRLMYSLDRLTDITHWEKDQAMVLTIMGPDPGKHLIFYPTREENGKVMKVFTKTELKVLILLSEGLSSKEIAEQAHIAFNTVNTHRRNMLRKAHVKNTTELLQYARVHSII